MRKKIVLTLVSIAAIAVGIGFYMYNKPVQSLEKAATAFKISADALFDEFDTDEITAQQLYGGKVLEVAGVVGEIITNEDESVSLLLTTNHPIFGVKCRLDPLYNKTDTPSQGERIKLKGLCTGFNSDVELNQCILLKN